VGRFNLDDFDQRTCNATYPGIPNFETEANLGGHKERGIYTCTSCGSGHKLREAHTRKPLKLLNTSESKTRTKHYNPRKTLISDLE
jgi:hypothetical protein